VRLTIIVRSPDFNHIKDCLRRFIDVYPYFDKAKIELHLEDERSTTEEVRGG